MAATGEIRQRKDKDLNDAVQDVGDGKEEGTGMLRGVLSCFAGVGGVAIVLWLVIYVFLEPYDPNKSVCTSVGSVDELVGSLGDIEAINSKWRLFGEKMGMSRAQMDNIMQDGLDDSEIAETLIRMWYKSKKKACWETVVQALVKMKEVKSAIHLAKKHHINFKY